jgi:hypothetical protein
MRLRSLHGTWTSHPRRPMSLRLVPQGIRRGIRDQCFRPIRRLRTARGGVEAPLLCGIARTGTRLLRGMRVTTLQAQFRNARRDPATPRLRRHGNHRARAGARLRVTKDGFERLFEGSACFRRRRSHTARSNTTDLGLTRVPPFRQPVSALRPFLSAPISAPRTKTLWCLCGRRAAALWVESRQLLL